MAFRVGQKVVCVNDHNWPQDDYGPTLPTRGAVYTVRSLVPCVHLGYDEDGVRLVEIVNRRRMLSAPNGSRRRTELCFRMSRFRPLRTTNIDVFTRMLEPAPQEAAELVEA